MNEDPKSELVSMNLAEGYQELADREREREAEEWCEALVDEIN
jgi:hypothetical protein